MLDLHNQRILVTRPGQAGIALCDDINQLNGIGIHFPTIAFTAPDDPNQFQFFIDHLATYEALIFVSPQAVASTLPAIKAIPPHINLFAVGEGTATALAAYGYKALYPKDNWTSEGLLQLPQLQSVHHKKIAIISGEEGRTLLQTSLQTRGATVRKISSYKRILPNFDTTIAQTMLQQGLIDCIVCTSFDAVKHLQQLLSNVDVFLKQVPLLVVSERIKMLAETLGFQTIWVAQNASKAAILTTLQGMNHAR